MNKRKVFTKTEKNYLAKRDSWKFKQLVNVPACDNLKAAEVKIKVDGDGYFRAKKMRDFIKKLKSVR